MTSFDEGIVYFDNRVDLEYLTRDEGQKFRETFILKLEDITIEDYVIEKEGVDDRTLNIEINYPGLDQWKCMVSNNC